MNADELWKNFALGIEVDTSGAFIYNGIKYLDELKLLNHSVDIFEILYNLSVGLERLIKIAIILVEHNDITDMEEFEKSLISHNTLELSNRLGRHIDLELSDIHREFLALLSVFYKTHRYQRYTFLSAFNIDEKRSFLEYLQKHLKLSIDIDNELRQIDNTDQIRKFIGKIMRKISSKVFEIISNECFRLNIYTTELRGDSKALKVFYGEYLNFIDERVMRKEILLHLMNPKVEGGYINLMRSFETLDFDVDMTSLHIQSLFDDNILSMIEGEVDELYSELKNVGERLELMKIIGSEMEEEDKPFIYLTPSQG